MINYISKILVNKILTLEIFKLKVSGWERFPTVGTARGWDEADVFLKQHGVELQRSDFNGIKMISMLPGWSSRVVSMDNYYDDGSMETI